MKRKPKTYFIKGGLYTGRMIEAIAMAIHLEAITPIELKRYLDGEHNDAYNLLCELIRAKYNARKGFQP